MIGIFDSGLGGLISFREIKKILPQYSYIYLGDNLRSPYGGRSKEAIYKFSENAIKFLFNSGCKLIIIACNSASVDALSKLQQEYLPKFQPKSYNILGVVRPIIEEAIRVSKNKRIGLVGTRATIDSSVYETEIHKLDREFEIFKTSCPLLVPLIEEGFISSEETKSILKKYLNYFQDKNIDTLILGCTHYPILINDFRSILDKNINVIDSSLVLAQKLQDYLLRHSEIESILDKNQKTKYFITDNTENFVKTGQNILGENVEFEKVIIE